jgi:hypothetical protein
MISQVIQRSLADLGRWICLSWACTFKIIPITPLLFCEIWRLMGLRGFFAENSNHPSLSLNPCPPAVRHHYTFLKTFKLLGLKPSFDSFEGSNPFELSHDFESFRKPFLSLLAVDFQTLPSVGIFRLCAHLQQQSLNTSLRFATLRLHSTYTLLAWLLCLTVLLCEWEQNLSYLSS